MAKKPEQEINDLESEEEYTETDHSGFEDSDAESDDDDDDDDSEDDPTYSAILDRTQRRLSSLSIGKKTTTSKKTRDLKENRIESDAEDQEVKKKMAGADPNKDLELVRRMINAGQVEKLKVVDQCKMYLKEHGLRRIGKKEVLLQRIKEHQEILNGKGEEKYPQSSFVINCKGDACTGDVVMFEQNVYERSRRFGPPCGERIVAGRVVKESYGAAKQQHTFTIEVLWSKGDKPLPPLHPLLIKGRNLYRLKTMRMKWEDGAARQKILKEKHNRGQVARSDREARVQEKEARKALRTNRILKQEEQRRCHQKTEKGQSRKQLSTSKENIPPFDSVPEPFLHSPRAIPNSHFIQRPNSPLHFRPSSPNLHQPAPPLNFRPASPNLHQPASQHHFRPSSPNLHQPHLGRRLNSWEINQRSSSNFCPPWVSSNRDHGSPQRPCRAQQKQVCRYYARGRCYYGDRCKYLHESNGGSTHNAMSR